MERPKYKELYLAEKKNATYWKNVVEDMRKETSTARNEAVKAAQGRADVRNEYFAVYRRSADFLAHIRRDLFKPAVDKNGWLYIPALAPEDAQSILKEFGEFSSYINRTRPSAL